MTCVQNPQPTTVSLFPIFTQLFIQQISIECFLCFKNCPWNRVHIKSTGGPLSTIPKKLCVAIYRPSCWRLCKVVPQINHHPQLFPEWLGPVPVPGQRFSCTRWALCQKTTTIHNHRSSEEGTLLLRVWNKLAGSPDVHVELLMDWTLAKISSHWGLCQTHFAWPWVPGKRRVPRWLHPDSKNLDLMLMDSPLLPCWVASAGWASGSSSVRWPLKSPAILVLYKVLPQT